MALYWREIAAKRDDGGIGLHQDAATRLCHDCRSRTLTAFGQGVAAKQHDKIGRSRHKQIGRFDPF
ncbi:hypothetical protein, partial [Escherichia coli]|uniref:hypothetical protein n=1 Tax=Escherichia coli TaxID=562 RepID=UPI003D36FAD7